MASPGWQDYRRAESFLPWNAEKLVSGAYITPKWIDDGDSFWYRVKRRDGQEFMLVDATTGAQEQAFDHVRLAAALSQASGAYYVHSNLPFDTITLTNNGNAIRFKVDDVVWTCDLTSYKCTRTEPDDEPKITELKSPDGKWAAYAKDHNLWVRGTSDDGQTALSHDGVPGQSYGVPVMSPLIDAGLAKSDHNQYPIAELFPAAIWSPDSKKIISHRLDERGVGQYHLIQSVPLDGSVRQRLHSFTYPLPGDEKITTAELVIFDVETRAQIAVDLEPLNVYSLGSPLKRKPGKMASGSVWWSDDGERVYILKRGRGFFSLALFVVDARTGGARQIIEETSNTPIDPHLTSAGEPNVRVVDGGANVVWFSQRDGWGHLYLYDGKTGELKHQITSGDWAVADVLHVDDAQRMIYFTAVGREDGRDPYYAYLYRVPFDGGEPQLLTPDAADHLVKFSPFGRYFIDTYSTVDTAPTTELRSAEGMLIAELERADIDLLLETGWRPPERFRAKARDGVTDVYGVIFRPSTFAPARAYPVLDYIYGGPQTNQAPVSFADISRGRRGGNFWHAQALAELGFIVVMIDGLGMPFRSKAYHDVSYKNLGDAGLPDHITALEQLARRYPYLDLDRVGIFGHSGGGYASCRAMFTYPDFYKVAVSSSGNHDDPVYNPGWTERYMGYPVGDHYLSHSNRATAQNLKGKLLLVHGEMDENVHLVSTLVVVDALIKANKDFDLLVMPNRIHSLGNDPYFIRRRWDYFVRHLLGMEPPSGYQIQEGPEEPGPVSRDLFAAAG